MIYRRSLKAVEGQLALLLQVKAEIDRVGNQDHRNPGY
jgi:hypothetical protein